MTDLPPDLHPMRCPRCGLHDYPPFEEREYTTHQALNCAFCRERLKHMLGDRKHQAPNVPGGSYPTWREGDPIR